MKVSRIFNSGVASRKLDASAFPDIITSVLYRLFDIKAIDGTCTMHPVANAIHLGLIAFMTTFLIQFGRSRRMRYAALSRKFKKALDNTTFQAAVDPATHLWLLVIADIAVPQMDGRSWIKPRLVEAVSQFGATDWEFARRLLGKYPWIKELHDQPAAQLWEACFPLSVDDH